MNKFIFSCGVGMPVNQKKTLAKLEREMSCLVTMFVKNTEIETKKYKKDCEMKYSQLQDSVMVCIKRFVLDCNFHRSGCDVQDSMLQLEILRLTQDYVQASAMLLDAFIEKKASMEQAFIHAMRVFEESIKYGLETGMYSQEDVDCCFTSCSVVSEYSFLIFDQGISSINLDQKLIIERVRQLIRENLNHIRLKY